VIRVAFVTTGLGRGGAEMSLLALVQNLDRTRFEPRVISLTTLGVVGPRLAALGVPVTAIGLRARPLSALVGLVRLLREVARVRPQVVQTWMYHADLLGGLAARWAGVDAVVWGIRNSDLASGASRRSTVAVAHLCALLSIAVPRAIVSVSFVARDIHRRLGYRSARFVVIGNGFDLSLFVPEPAVRGPLRQSLGLSETTPLVLHVGRFHPQKDHHGLLRAAARLHQVRPDVHFVLAGDGVDADNPELSRAIAAGGLTGVVHCLGPRDDAQRLMAGSDLLVLSSRSGEAFPRVLGEAMACGLPCVATDVGDSRAIVEDCGRIVAPQDDAALAKAILDMLSMPDLARAELGRRARERAVALFDIRQVARDYEDLYSELAPVGQTQVRTKN
jgi:glycosyltransferase involved in cell wall biosynthesis